MMESVENQEDCIIPHNCGIMESVENQEEIVDVEISFEDLIKTKTVIKSSKANKGKNAGTWVHPLMFIDIAMWMSPEFKYDALSYIQKNLIKTRVDSVSLQKRIASMVFKMTSSEIFFDDIEEIGRDRIKKVNRAINTVVYGHHEDGMRNTIDEIHQLYKYQERLLDLFDDGYINTYDDLKKRITEDLKKRGIIAVG